jgi:hypothetical protein
VFLVLLVGELQGWTVRPWPPPRLPTLVGQRSASVLGPTRGGIADVDYSPPFKVLWGTPPRPPPWGLRPPGPPVCPPSWAKGPPAFRVPLVAGLLMWTTRPLLKFCGGTPPTAPRHGGFAPLDPRLPAFVGFGFASVLGVNLSLGPSPRRRGENPAKFSPFPRREGGQGVRSERHTPTIPRHGGFASWPPPFARFRGLRVCRRLGFHSWRGCQCGQIAPDFGFVGGTLPTMGLLTCLGLRNDVKRLTKVGLSW